MEDLKIAVWIFSGVTMFTCLLFLFFIRRWQHRHPNIFTEKATPDEKLMYKKMSLLALNTILLYILVFMIVISFMAYAQDADSTPPIAPLLLFGVGVVAVVTNIISTCRKR